MTSPTDPDTAERQLETLYRSYVRRVYGFARNRVGETEATDVVSEVFHAAALAFACGGGDEVTPAWLIAVARNKVNDHWRRAYRRKAKRHLTDAAPADLVEFPDGWADDSRRDRVLDALDRLPAADRSLLVLHHVDGMRTGDLAEVMGKSVAAIESALARARRRFRREYGPDESSEPSGDEEGDRGG